MIDNPVHTVVAAATDCPASVRGGAAIAHPENQIDDETFEEGGRCRANSIEQILPELYLDLLVSCPHDFVGRLRAAYERRLNQLNARCGVICRLLFELPELGELIEKFIVDA